MKKYHLFYIINTRRKIEIFQNEKFYFTLHRAGPLPWKKPTNRSKLPVSTPTAYFPADIWLLAERKAFILICVYSDFDLNAICHENCIEETYKCIMSCEPTDSTCIYTCLRAEDSCGASKNFHVKMTKKFGSK